MSRPVFAGVDRVLWARQVQPLLPILCPGLHRRTPWNALVYRPGYDRFELGVLIRTQGTYIIIATL